MFKKPIHLLIAGSWFLFNFVVEGFWRRYRKKYWFDIYHCFPFDTNQAMPTGAIKVMEEGCGIIEGEGYKYTLADGTLLGAFRNQGFIPHDTDIDINIIGELDCDPLKKKFADQGMKLGRIAWYKNKLQQMIFYDENNIIFDICIWRQKGDSIYNYSEEPYERKQPLEYYRETRRIVLYGRTYPAPAPLESWLVMRYGRDWKTPKKSKGDWKKECLDMKKIKANWIVRLYFRFKDRYNKSKKIG
jgi:hypothetical protein